MLGSIPEKISCDWVNYELRLGSLIVPFKQKLHLKGPRLNTSKAERGSKMYAKDLRNKINVIEQMPLLQVSFMFFTCKKCVMSGKEMCVLF